MKGRFDWNEFKAAAKPAKAGAKKVRGFVYINMAAWQEDEIRALAECMGLAFRDFLNIAFRGYYHDSKEELEREMGVKMADVLRMPKAARREIGRKRMETRRACRSYGMMCPQKN
jgi:hypothetical protein